MTPRNPNGSTPRTLRDGTFCDWADPFERPEPEDAALTFGLFCALIVVAAVGVLLWRYTV
jgi:hypothetical protein